MAHILLIDDDDTLRAMLRHALERAHHSVLAVSDGQQALRQFSDSVQLIIIDMLMPHMGGLETIDALKKRKPSVPIIGISGGGEIPPEEYLSVARIIGADYTLIKPFDHAALLCAVNELLAEPVSS
jgi:DNA-binding response OmpR family regulator